LSAKDAFDVIAPLGENTEHKLSLLEDKFWFWETIEEAIRINMEQLNDD